MKASNESLIVFALVPSHDKQYNHENYFKLSTTDLYCFIFLYF